MSIQSVKSEITGTVWKIAAQAGDALAEDGVILILESMKMEIPVTAPIGCTLISIEVNEGDPVTEGDIVAMIRG